MTATLGALTDRQVLDSIGAEIDTLRASYARLLEWLAEADSRGPSHTLGYGSIAGLLVGTFNLPPGEARRMVAQARDLHPTIAISGATVAAKCPHTARALAEGRVDPGHVEVIRKALATLGDLSPEQVEEAELALLEQAQRLTPSRLATVAERIRDHVDPDGDPPKEEPEKKEPRQYLSRRQGGDGRWHFHGWLDAESGSVFNALLLPLERPRTGEGERDTRGAGERAGSALADLVIIASNAPDLPVHNGVKTEVTMTLSYERTREEARNAGLIGDEYVSAAEARRVACDAHVIPAVLGTKSQPLDVASPSYVVPAHIRRALVLRDRGCTHPGCDRPAAACHSHHVESWVDGGETKLINLALVCQSHHLLVHASEWEIQLKGGRVWWVPPTYIDPDRTPRLNELHRRLDL